jgi:membrane protein DedA with SNARE-associated domain
LAKNLLLLAPDTLSRAGCIRHNGGIGTPPVREAIVEEFLHSWGYLGIFVGIILTGMGFPMPEELPVVIGGGLVHDTNAADLRWWLMLVTCIIGVVVGDSCLYLIGRFGGVRLLDLPFVKRLLTPEHLDKISHNFDKYGVKILLFARLTPGIRMPIFVTAGITRLPLIKFLLADGIYAIPGVTLLFVLGYWFTDTVVDLIRAGESQVRNIVYLVILVGIAGYFIYRHLRRPVVEGSPKEMPPVVEQVTQTLDHTLGTVKDKLLHSNIEIKCDPCEPQPRPGDGPATAANGEPEAKHGHDTAAKVENGRAEPGAHPAPHQPHGEHLPPSP